jgi:hypothetical protein
MSQSAEDSVRIAILSEPSAFGLTASDTNPMLLYQLRKNEPEYSEQGTAELWKLCFDSVNSLLYEKVTEVFAGVSRRKDELVRDATATDSQEQPAPVKSNGKPKCNGKETEASNGNSNGRGDKLTVKQLRYMGFLYRKLGEEPDYSVISVLTQGQATMRIKDLEQRVNE